MRLPDVTLAIRHLVRRPSYAATAILLLALGAGANAAVFSVVRAVLLKPLPYHEPERLVAVWPGTFVSNEELGYWRARVRGVEAIASISPGWLMALVADGVEPLKVTGGRVSDDFFTTLGTPAALGRTLLPGDAHPGRTGVVVISWDLYERQFGGDTGTIGRRVRLDGVEHEVVGVMPRGFEFLEPGTDLWSPLAFDPNSRQHRGPSSLAFARLARGVMADTLTRELQSLAPQMRSDLAKNTDWGRDIRVVALRDRVTGEVRPTLLILLGAVGLILVLAAVNVGTLWLAQSIARSREMAVRAAVGASRLRLVKQLMTEHLVLAVAGATAGLAVAFLALPALVRAIPADMPRQTEIALDTTVVLIVFTVSLVVSIVMATVPALITSRSDLQPLLRARHGAETPARRRAMSALAVAQVATAIVLGVGAGLMLRSLWNLQHVDPGFEATRVLTFRLQTTSKYNGLATGIPYFDQVVARVRAVPGVTHVGSIQHLPMTGYNWAAHAHPVERPPAPGTTAARVTWRFIGWDYFAAMQIPLRAGRLFTAHDRRGAPPVAIVNEVFARQEYGSASAAVGQRVAMTSGAGPETVEIVGVVGDVRSIALDQPATPELYRPLEQTFMFPMAFVVRTASSPVAVAAAVRQAVSEVDGVIPVAELQPLTSLIAASLGRPRLLAMLLSVFAAVGVALSVVGVYGTVAFRVRQFERELGIRLALGAQPGSVARRVVTQGARYAIAGLALGVPAALGLGGLLQGLVYGITPRDPLTLVTFPLAVGATTLAACLVPATRAARVDPVQTLRAE